MSTTEARPTNQQDHSPKRTKPGNALPLRDQWLGELVAAGRSARTISRLRATTNEALKRVAEKCECSVAQLNLEDLTRAAIVDVLQRYRTRPDGRTGDRKERSQASVNLFRSGLSGWFSWCVALKLLETNEVENIPKAPTPRRLPRHLEPDQCSTLAQTAASSRNGARDDLMASLGFCQGARLDEMVGINLPDDFLPSPEDPIKLRLRGKGDKEREVPVSRAVRRKLAVYLPVRAEILRLRGGSETALLLSQRGNRLSQSGAGQAFDRAMRACQLKQLGRRAHATRHAFAMALLDGGAKLVEVQKLLGHASIETTAAYLHARADGLRAAIDNSPVSDL